MKKGKVFGKTQVAVTVMVLALALAIWLNVKYTPTATKYLGEATYVSNTESKPQAVQTSAKAEPAKEDYFDTAKKEREAAYTEARETVEETLKKSKLTEEEKKQALERLQELSVRLEQENKIETLLKAKGFEKAVAVIGDGNVSVVVRSEGLTSAQTLQIQDVVTGQTQAKLSEIKIIPIR